MPADSQRIEDDYHTQKLSRNSAYTPKVTTRFTRQIPRAKNVYEIKNIPFIERLSMWNKEGVVVSAIKKV